MCQNVPAMNMVELIHPMVVHLAGFRGVHQEVAEALGVQEVRLVAEVLLVGRVPVDHLEEKALHLAVEMLVLQEMLGAWIIKNAVSWKDIRKHHVTPYKILSTFALTITITLNNAYAKRA